MSPRLHLPPGQHFECTSCGRCCQASWTIAVDAQAEPGIRSSHAYQRRAREGFVPLVVTPERLTLAKTEGHCTFLLSDNMCELHSELGGERKPLVCQSYPYLFTETPDGVYATLSYACPAALEGVGPSVESSRASVEELVRARWDEMPQGEPVGSRVEVLRGRWLAWSDYLVLEKEILAAYSPEQPIFSLLGAAVHLLLHESGDLSSTDYQVPSDGWKLSEPYNFGGFDSQLATMVACNLTATTENISSPEERAQVGNFLWNGGRHMSRRFGFELPVFTLSRPASGRIRDAIDQYVRNSIFGKRLLSGTVVSRLLALSCGIAILLFYIEAFQSQDGDEAAALDRAFALIESELLSHTRSFDGFFVEFEESLRNVRDALRGG